MKLIIKGLLLIAACAAQLAWSADPLDNWTTSNLSLQGGLVTAAFGNGLFVGVGSLRDTNGNFLAGTIATSPDGVAWTQRNSGIINDGLAAATYGNGQFVAVSLGGTVITSPDGVAWTVRRSGTGGLFYGITHGNGQFVAVGGYMPAGTIVTSSDGVDWVIRVSSATTSNLPPAFGGVTYGNGHFVALSLSPTEGGNVEVATSTDGINWTLTPNGPYFGYGSPAMTFGNGLFVAVGGDYLNRWHAIIYTSPDGLNWSLRQDYTDGVNGAFTFVSYGGGQFIAGGGGNLDPTNYNSSYVYTSGNGTNWVGHDVPAATSTLTFGNGRFVGVGGTNAVRSGVIGKLGASLSPGSGVQGTITGVTGQSYAIKASTNLAAWTVVTNLTINTNGLAEFSDPSTASVRQRFYQALLTQP